MTGPSTQQEGILSLVIFGAACFAKVFLAIIQAKNVQHSLYVAAFLTSLLMSAADILYIRLVVSHQILLAFIVGALSNATAVICALYVFRRVRS